MPRTTEVILTDAAETLASAKLGLSMIREPAKRRAGVRTVIVFGRAFTNVLQNLRREHGAIFDAWYSRYQTEMKNDDLMTYFYALRSEILKEGTLRVSNFAALTGNPLELMNRYPKPAHAKGFFIGDQNGGSGWRIELPDGQVEKLYVELPEPTPALSVQSMMCLSDPPEKLRGRDIAELAQEYIEYFERMLVDAQQKFSKNTAVQRAQ